MHLSAEQTVDAAWARAQSAWPGVDVPKDLFRRHVEERVLPSLARPSDLDALHVEELYLAIACVTGDVGALGALDDRYLSEVRGYVAHIDRSPSFADDVVQQLYDKLVVGGEAP